MHFESIDGLYRRILSNYPGSSRLISHRIVAASIMSKLSEPLKAFINSPHARPNTAAAPKHIASVYDKIATDAGAKKVGLPAWLSISVRLPACRRLYGDIIGTT